MNYKRLYDNIINNAKNRQLECYTEKHHIVPKCLGGSDSTDNIVSLLPKEHYIVHHLLWRMYPQNKKLAYAFSMMTVINEERHQRYVTSRGFEAARKIRSENIKGKNNPMFGKKSAFTKHTEETKKRIGEAASKRNKGSTRPKRGALPLEVRMKIAEANLGQIPWNKGTSDKQYTCPKCGKIGGNSAMKRYHGDKCKNV